MRYSIGRGEGDDTSVIKSDDEDVRKLKIR